MSWHDLMGIALPSVHHPQNPQNDTSPEAIEDCEHTKKPPTQSSSVLWLAEWRKLAKVTAAITSRDDPRFEPVMAALDRCTARYRAGDGLGFQAEAKQILLLLSRDGVCD